MKEYLQKREKLRKLSVVSGALLTVGVHAAAVAVVSFSGLKYIWPPSEETSLLVDFVEMEEDPMTYGKEPVSQKVDKEKPVEIVQKSKSPETTPTKNLTQESTPDPFGDVEVPQPEPEPEPEKPKPDPRASFGGINKKPSTSTVAHSASESSNEFKAGQADGNAKVGPTEGEANAHLEGRQVDGYLQKPVYNSQEGGVVVVNISVTHDGIVKTASMNPELTTISDKTMIQAAINAAYKTRFTKQKDITSETPPLQKGTITYYFKLK